MLDNNFYDALADDAEPRPTPCPICTGDEEAEPCTEECNELVIRCRNEQRIKALYKAARNALFFAHQYKGEGYPDFHIVAIVEQVRACRTRIRALRSAA